MRQLIAAPGLVNVADVTPVAKTGLHCGNTWDQQVRDVRSE